MMAGAITWLFGSILKASVSREREYLADACSVQFTRNPDGIVSALKAIENQARSPKFDRNGMSYSHLFFDDRNDMSRLFATHPPLAKRIEAIEGKKYFPEEWKQKS
jgi:heat shock protein HtpX